MVTAFHETSSNMISPTAQELEDFGIKLMERHVPPHEELEKGISQGLAQESDGERAQQILNAISNTAEPSVQVEQDLLTEQTMVNEVDIVPEIEKEMEKEVQVQELENEVHLPQEMEKEIQLAQELEKDVQLDQEIKKEPEMEKEVELAQKQEEMVQLAQETEKEIQLSAEGLLKQANEQKVPLEQRIYMAQPSAELQKEPSEDLDFQTFVEDDQIIMDVEVDTVQSETSAEQETQAQAGISHGQDIDEILQRMSKKRKLIELEQDDETTDPDNDPDRLFLMSLMPALKRVRGENVNMVKAKIVKVLQKGMIVMDNQISVASSTAEFVFNADGEHTIDLLQNGQEEPLPHICDNLKI